MFTDTEADQNCVAELFTSEICGLLLFEDSADLPTDWTDRAAWIAAINNLDTTGNFGKYVVGVGKVDAAEKTQIVVGKGKKVTVLRQYSVTLTVYNLSNKQYNFLRKLQCNPTRYRFFTENTGGHIFGGSNAIRPAFTDVDFVYAEGEESVEQATITIEWKAKCDPPRTYLPNLSSGFNSSVVNLAYAPDTSNNEYYATSDGGDEYYAPFAWSE